MPPEIIVFNRIKNLEFSVASYDRTVTPLVCLVDEAIHRHHPSNKKPVFPKDLRAVGRACGVAWAPLTIHLRDMTPHGRGKPGADVEFWFSLLGWSTRCYPTWFACGDIAAHARIEIKTETKQGDAYKDPNC